MTTRRQLLGTALHSLGGIALLSGCTTSTAHSNVWRSLRPAPTKRTEVGAAELNGRIYVAGGYLISGETVATVEAYDVAHDTWETVAPLPAPRNHLTLASLAGKLFAIGGNDGVGGDAEKPSATVWAFQPTPGKWESVAPLPAPRAAHAVAVDKDRLYIVGGVGPNPLPTLIYNPTTDKWTESAPIPTERDHLGATFVNGKVIAVAGRTGDKERPVVEAYTPASDTWETLPSLPTARHGLSVMSIGNTVYAIGGETFEGKEQTFTTQEALDVTTGTWRALSPLPTARHGAGGIAYQGLLYILSGGPEPDLAVTNVVEVYLP